MICIMMCGAPVTGKSTSTEELKNYFEEQGKRVTVISKNPNDKHDVAAQIASLTIFKVMSERNADILIVDSSTLTVFDREDLVTISPTNTEDPWIAIYHNRSYQFIQEHNKDAGHKVYTSQTISALRSMDQQPIRAEGFAMVYHVSGMSHLDIAGFLRNLNRITGSAYPIPEADTKAVTAND